MKNKSQTVRIPRGCLWINSHPFAQDSKGTKMHMCWPEYTDDAQWLLDVQSILKSGDTPRYVTYDAGKQRWHFKLSCYHGGEGWWYEWDAERSPKTSETYRLFIPREIAFHPDFEPTQQKELV